MLKYLSKFLPLQTLNQIYKTLVRCHLDYCDIIYHIPPHHNQPPLGVSLNYLMEMVERIQYQAALAITGTSSGSSRLKLYGNPYQNVGRVGVFYMFIKFTNKMFPSHLKDKLPPNSRAFSGNIRNTFCEITCKSNRYKYSFFLDAISSWNTLIKHFDNVPTFDILRKHIITFFCPQMKSIFGTHDHVGLRYWLKSTEKPQMAS